MTHPSGNEPAAPVQTLTVLMPVYNERTTLGKLIERIRAVPVEKEILIVDDASTDGTREYLRSEVEGRYPEVRTVFLDTNGGKGTAIRAGLPHVRGEYVVIQDGDLEYDPADFVRLLSPAKEQGASIVYGNRFANGWPAMRLPNRVINIILAGLVRWLYGASLNDEATGYKLFRSDVLRSIPLRCRRFEFCPEVTAKALRMGHTIVEVPISYVSRTHAEGKKIRWTDGVEAIWTLLRYRLWRGPR